MIQDSSLAAYEIAKKSLCDRQLEVFEFISNHERCTDKEISEGLNLEINKITNRRGELVEKGLVLYAGKKLNSAGTLVKSWRANEWARKYPSGRSMPKPAQKPAAAQIEFPGLINSWDF